MTTSDDPDYMKWKAEKAEAARKSEAAAAEAILVEHARVAWDYNQARMKRAREAGFAAVKAALPAILPAVAVVLTWAATAIFADAAESDLTRPDKK